MQINKAKSICECLIASEGIDLKFEEAFCLFLLGLVCFYRFNLNYWSCCYEVFRHFEFESWFLAAIFFLSFQLSNFLRDSTTSCFINVIFNLGHRGRGSWKAQAAWAELKSKT